MWYCREIDSEGDEVDDGEPYKGPAAAAATDEDADESINYYVWYAVNINVCPAEPHDTLTVSCPCLVSKLGHINKTSQVGYRKTLGKTQTYEKLVCKKCEFYRET